MKEIYYYVMVGKMYFCRYGDNPTQVFAIFSDRQLSECKMDLTKTNQVVDYLKSMDVVNVTVIENITHIVNETKVNKVN